MPQDCVAEGTPSIVAPFCREAGHENPETFWIHSFDKERGMNVVEPVEPFALINREIVVLGSLCFPSVIVLGSVPGAEDKYFGFHGGLTARREEIATLHDGKPIAVSL